MLTILSAAGKDVILVETVGVGQDEVEIVGAADVSVVVLVPGLGDEVQALKAGIMEIADVFVVNKADREGVERVVAEIESMLSLAAHDGERPAIVKTVATADQGVAELLAAVEEFRARAGASGLLARKQRAHLRQQFEETLRARLLAEVRRARARPRRRRSASWTAWPRAPSIPSPPPTRCCSAVGLRSGTDSGTTSTTWASRCRPRGGACAPTRRSASTSRRPTTCPPRRCAPPSCPSASRTSSCWSRPSRAR